MVLSLMDNDLYKLTMMQAVFELYPDAEVKYRFTNRGIKQANGTRDRHMATDEFLAEFRSRVEMFRGLRFTAEELEKIKSWGFFKPGFFAFLKDFSLNPDDVIINCIPHMNGTNELSVVIKGNWCATILWEVPLLYMISETYYKTLDRDWDYAGQDELVRKKVGVLDGGGCYYVDFGTRRRRSFRNQDHFVKIAKANSDGHFVGTSNMYLAMKHDVKVIGTYAHEFIMAHQVLGGIRHCNKYAMEAWQQVYNGDLGIALTDTTTSEAFYNDFDPVLSRCFDGVRQDSGCPFAFTDMAVAHYEKLGISPKTKTIIYSDGLDDERAVEIQEYADKKKIKAAFGIGTFFTGDGFKGSPALNIVIKMYMLNGIHVVKLSDSPGKATGNTDAVRVAKWIVNGEMLS